MSKQNELPFRSRIQSFVRRAGRLTTGQARALKELLPIYGLQLANGVQDLSAIFARSAATVLEIGFGNGCSLLEMARQTPQTNFIGIEVHPPGVGALLLGIEKHALTNIRIYQEDAVEILQYCIPENSLARIQIYFPDPWPKKKHHKRRLLQPSFVDLAYSKLTIGGTLHIATDWQGYAKQMLQLLENTSGLTNQAGRGNFSLGPVYRPTTKFEHRGQTLGHGVWDLLYLKKLDSTRITMSTNKAAPLTHV